VISPLRRTLHVSPFIRDLAFTTFTSGATIAALIAAIRLLAEGLGPDGFGAYMLARRILSTIDPLSTLAMGIALTRYVALVDGRAKHDYLIAGMALAIVPGALAMLLSLGFARPLATLFFLNGDYAPLVRATGWMIFGYSWFTVLYAWYRAVGRMTLANIWQLGAIAAAPLVLAAIYNRPGGETWIVLWSGAALFAAACPMLLEARRGFAQGAIVRGAPLRALVAYGAPRVPGGLAFAGLLAVGPFLAPYYGSLRDVGYVAVGQSILRVVEGGTEAFGRVALPKISRLMATEGIGRLQERVADVVAVVLHLGLFVTLHLWLWTSELTRVWLGATYLDAVPVIRVSVIGILPYLTFVTLRSIIDAIEERAINANNLYMSLGVTVALALTLARLRYGAVGLAIATTAGFTLLGGLTFGALWRRCRFALRPLLIPECVALNALLVGIAAAARRGFYASNVSVPLAALVLEVVLAAIYAFGLWKLRARWIGEFTRRVVLQEVAG
jgi:O-antigen/teichoic acid export membrane protein